MTVQGKSKRKVEQGIVKSAKMQKTVVVEVMHLMQHPFYKKIVSRAKKYYAHNESIELKEGDTVKIIETKPRSKLKRWAVVERMKEAHVPMHGEI